MEALADGEDADDDVGVERMTDPTPARGMQAAIGTALLLVLGLLSSARCIPQVRQPENYRFRSRPMRSGVSMQRAILPYGLLAISPRGVRVGVDSPPPPR